MYYDLLSKEEVWKMLHVKDGRNVTNRQVIKLASNIVNMDRETARVAIKQFPSFAQFAQGALSNYYKVIEKALENEPNEALEIYKNLTDTLIEETKNENLSEEQKQEYIEKILDIAREVNSIKEADKDRKMDIIKTVSQATLSALVVVSSVLGASATISNSINGANKR